MNRTFQVGTRCPGSGSKGRIARNASEQDGTDPENADPAECRFWSGADCSSGSILSPTLAERLIQVNESGALVSGSLKNTSDHVFTTAEQTYTYFSFNVDDPNKDVAFIVDIQDDTDVAIYASFDDPKPSAVNKAGSGHKWTFDNANSTNEVLQLCGSFSYKKRCQCDESTGDVYEMSTSEDCPQGLVPQTRPYGRQ